MIFPSRINTSLWAKFITILSWVEKMKVAFFVSFIFCINSKRPFPVLESRLAVGHQLSTTRHNRIQRAGVRYHCRYCSGPLTRHQDLE